jgi:hypothetical protein
MGPETVILGLLENIRERNRLLGDEAMLPTVVGEDKPETDSEAVEEGEEQREKGPGERGRESEGCSSFVIPENPSVLRPWSAW